MFFVVGGREVFLLELYDGIIDNLDEIKKWNEEMMNFMAKEHQPSSLFVTF